MQPPAPPRFSHRWTDRLGLNRHFGLMSVMSVRHIIRWPLRAFMTTLGVALAGSLLVVSLFTFDSIEHMIDVSFSMTQRQDATLTFVDQSDEATILSAARLPGVMRVEPFRSVLVRMRNGQFEKKIAVHAKPLDPALSRIINRSLRPEQLPEFGLMVDQRVADILHLRRGDLVEIEVLGGWRAPERGLLASTGTAEGLLPSSLRLPITAVIESYFGLSAFMSQPSLNRLLGEGAVVSGVHLQYDSTRERALFQALKSTPRVAGVGLRRVSLAKFRETLAKNIDMMVSIYAGLAIVVAIGVVYNSARIQLSEQARELASLRVLGFTRAEVSRVLLLELAILVAAAQPLAWLLGYGFGWLTIQGFSSDLYRAPFVIAPSTYAWATIVVVAAALASALIVRRRIDRLDLIAVLKTRE